MNFVFTAVSPKMQLLECMYIKQTIDLLQVNCEAQTQLFSGVMKKKPNEAVKLEYLIALIYTNSVYMYA